MRKIIILSIITFFFTTISTAQSSKPYYDTNLSVNYPKRWVSYHTKSSDNQTIVLAIAPKKEIRDVVDISSDIPYQKKQELKKV